jgi:hypothetical protein
MPKKGFLKNSNLAKLCEKKAAELSQSKLAETFKSQLDDLQLKLDELSNENKLGLEKIREYYDGLTNLSNLNVYDLCNLSNVNKQQPVSMRLLNSEQIAVVYRSKDLDDVEMAVFDTNFNLLRERICKTGRNFKNFLLNSMANNTIILCLIKPTTELNNYNNKSDDEGEYDDYRNTISIIKIFDYKLKKLNKTCLNHWIICLNTYDDKIFLVSSLSEMIQVYDKNLIFLTNIGQSKPNLPFYLPWYINKVEICEDYYVFLDRGEIKLLDRNSGWVKKRFEIDGNDFSLNTAKNSILTYNNESNQVLSYDFNGEAHALNINIPKAYKYIKLVDCLNDKLLFLNSNSQCLYFK